MAMKISAFLKSPRLCFYGFISQPPSWHEIPFNLICIRHFMKIPLENKHYKNNLRHKLFGTERALLNSRSPQKERNKKIKINNNNLSARQKEKQPNNLCLRVRETCNHTLRDTKLKGHGYIEITFACIRTQVPKSLNKFPWNTGREGPGSPSSTK